MTTTPAPTKNYAAIAATRCTAELNLVINLNESLLSDHANDVVTLPRDEHMLAHAVLAAARTELAHREELHAEARKIDADRDTWLAGTGERTLGHILTGDDMITGEGAVYITEKSIRTELHQRAEIDREHQAHLVSRKAAVRYLAGLIRKYGMDGEDISDMGHDEYNGMTRADRAAYPVPYTFLLSACDTLQVDGYDLLRIVVTSELGW